MKRNKIFLFRRLFISLAVVFSLYLPASTLAVSSSATLTATSSQTQKQSAYPLEKKYLSAENDYLKKYPDLQDALDAFYHASLKDIGDANSVDMNVAMTHTRTVAAIMTDMAKSLPVKDIKIAYVTALMHDVDKMNPKDVLTDPSVFDQVKSMVYDLKAKGYFQNSPNFFANENILKTPGIGDQPATIHNLTSPLRAEKIMDVLGYSAEDIEKVKVAILEHSTQYWYFRDDIDTKTGISGAWEDFYPKTETPLGIAISDADNLAQLVPSLIIPQDSKWRGLARTRWGAKNPQEEGHIIYYVLEQMVDVQLSDVGKKESEEYWSVLRPQLMKLMDLDPNVSPNAVLGIPSYWIPNSEKVTETSPQDSVFSQTPAQTTSPVPATDSGALRLKIIIGVPLSILILGICGIFFYVIKQSFRA